MHTKWHSVKLGKLAKFRNGINYNKNNFGKGLKVINVKDFQNHSFVTFDDLEEINPDGLIREDNFLKKNDIIFVRSNGNRQLIGRSLFVRSCPERVTQPLVLNYVLIQKKHIPYFMLIYFALL